MVGDARVLRDATINLSGADVKIPERVGAVPVSRLRFDQAHVLFDGGIDAALPERLIGVS
jgi:hypothetical protein